jgi:hypothetical protein
LDQIPFSSIPAALHLYRLLLTLSERYGFDARNPYLTEIPTGRVHRFLSQDFVTVALTFRLPTGPTLVMSHDSWPLDPSNRMRSVGNLGRENANPKHSIGN